MPNWSHFIKDFLCASSEIPVKMNSVQTINPSSFFVPATFSEAQWIKVSLLSILGEAGCALVLVMYFQVEMDGGSILVGPDYTSKIDFFFRICRRI